MTPLRAVLFDMDGTLVDAFPPIVHALNTTLREFGHATMTELEIRRHTGRGNIGIRDLFGEEDADRASTRFLELHDAVYLQQVTPMEGAEPLLAWLRAHDLATAIVTSKGQLRAEAQVEVLGWTNDIDAIIGKVDGRPGKPGPEPVQLACKTLATMPEASVMIGDGIADMAAASAAGSRGLGLVGSFSLAELETAGASRCFSNLKEVLSWLKMQIR